MCMSRKARRYIIETKYGSDWCEAAASASLISANAVAHAMRPAYKSEGVEVRVRDSQEDSCGRVRKPRTSRIDHATTKAFLEEVSRLPNSQDHPVHGDLGTVPL